MEQRSQEWFDAREGKVTASAVGAILGLNPWKTREQAMQDLLFGSDFKGNVATQYGQDHEDIAAKEAEMMDGIIGQECGFFVHPQHHWLGASPDRLVADHAVMEIKCPYKLREDKAPIFKTLKEQPYYYAQTQTQMFVTGRTRCYFYQWAPFGDMLEIVNFNQEWWSDNFPKLEAFYQEYLARKNEDTAALEKAWYLAKHEYDMAKQHLEVVKESLIDAADGKSRKFGDINVTLAKRKGGYDYKKACTDAGLALDGYEKPDTEYWVVK